MARSWSRREVLGLVSGTAGVGLAGCLSGSPQGTTSSSPSPTSTAPVKDGPAAPAPSCPDGYQSLTPGWVVTGPGPLAGFELLLDRETYDHADEFTAELENVTTEEQISGSKSKFDVQHRRADGWHTIFGTSESPARWTDGGVVHQPGVGFTWRFTLTQDGLSGEVESGPVYQACQPIEPGAYRFVFWGITTERERDADTETDEALGVPFRVESADKAGE